MYLVNIKKLFSSDVIKAYKGVAEMQQENKSDEECWQDLLLLYNITLCNT